MLVLRCFVQSGERRAFRDASTGEDSYLAVAEPIKLISLGKRGNCEPSLDFERLSSKQGRKRMEGDSNGPI
jgi:hypothetical protein